MRFDFAMYDPSEKLVAVFEAKAKAGTTPKWAAEYRRNLLAHYGPVSAEYFGLITPESLYLWRGHQSGEEVVEPDVVIDLRGQFAGILGGTVSTLSPPAFELLVSSWLNRITEAENGEDDTLTAVGLRDAVRGGHITAQAAA